MSWYISYSTPRCVNCSYKYYYEVHLILILYQNAVLILIHHYNIMNMIITNIVCHREPLNCILLTILTLSLTHHLIISIGHNLLNISDLIVFVYPLPLFPGKDKYTLHHSFLDHSILEVVQQQLLLLD